MGSRIPYIKEFKGKASYEALQNFESTVKSDSMAQAFSLMNFSAWRWFICSMLLSANLAASAENETKTKSEPQEKTEQKNPVFRLHMTAEPSSLSPLNQKGSGASYLFEQISAPLLRVENSQIIPDRGECRFVNPKTINCKVLAGARWSNSDLLVAEDYVRTIKLLASPQSRALRSDLILPILNAEKVLKGELSPDALGVKASGPNLEISLEQEDPDFLWNLSHPVLTPTRENTDWKPESSKDLLSASAYKVARWDSQGVLLEPNEFWRSLTSNDSKQGLKNRPSILFRFIKDDLLALKMYESGQLDYLRSLPTQLIEHYRHRKDFKQFRQIRFDSIYLNLELAKDFRRQVALSLDFLDLKRLMSSANRPGCTGLPSQWTGAPQCLQSEGQSKPDSPANSKKPFEYWYSKAGGADHKRMAEWFARNVKQKLSLNVEIVGVDDKIFLEKLRSNMPAFFRKGLAPDRLTCFAFMKKFLPGASENILQWKNLEFEKTVAQLEKANPAKQQAQCREAIRVLLDDWILIPTGPIHFSALLKPEWKGLNLNEMNRLDLRSLYKSH